MDAATVRISWKNVGEHKMACINGIIYRIIDVGQAKKVLQRWETTGWQEVESYTYKSGGYSYPIDRGYFAGGLSSTDMDRIIARLKDYAEGMGSL